MMIPPDVVGIDVSKHYLDIFDGSTGKAERLPNVADELGELAMRLGDRFVVFEATGAYDERLRRALAAAGVAYARINPTKARHFAKAVGFLAKTDQVDARMLAALGSTLKPRPAEAADEARERLVRLHKRRDQLVASRKQERTRQRETHDPDLIDDIARHLAFLDQAIAAIEAKIAGHIAAEPRLKGILQLLVSIPGVGPLTATCLLAQMPELGQRSPKAIAALAGLAPLNQDSGLRRGQRSIRGGRKRVRDALYMAAVAATRSKSRFKASYNSLRANGKPAKLAFIALARKLLTVANAIVRDQQPFAA